MSTVCVFTLPIGSGVVCNPDGDEWHSTGSAEVSYVVTGLINGTSYTFRVRARNILGVGTQSAASSVAPIGPPGPPTGLTGAAGNKHINLAWTGPVSNGGSTITSYEYSINGTWTAIAGSSSTTTTHTVTSLANGTSYTFRVRAVNGEGNGGASGSVTAIPVEEGPGAPGNVAVAATGNGQVSLTWTTPTDTGGAAITYYEYSTDDGSTWTRIAGSDGGTLAYTISGLTNGTTYDIKIRG